jgi:Fic family protein
MKKLMEWINKNELKIHPVEFAALVDKKFVFIHPFIDGNGRLARLLMNLVLLRNEYSIALIPGVLRNEYIAALELAHTDDTRFREFIADRIINTQLDLLRLLTESGGVKQKDGGVKSGSELEHGGVNSLKQQILETVQQTPGLNTPALAATLSKSMRTTQRYLKKLSDDRKIEFRGAAKNGGYFPVGNNN